MNIMPFTPSSIVEAVDILQKGGVIAVPTETVYGLVARASDETAVQTIYNIKGRASEVPLQILVSDISMAEHVAILDERAHCIASAFCPGPITLVLPQKESTTLAPSINVGLDTIGVRIPNHKVIAALLEESQEPLAATSANHSGEPPFTDASAVVNSFSDALSMVIDGGKSEIGVASTVLDLTTTPHRVLREGAITEGAIEAILSEKRS